MTDFLTNIAPGIFHTLRGLVCLSAGWWAFWKNDGTEYGTAPFWVFIGVIFILREWTPSTVIGGILMVMGVLTVSRQTRIDTFRDVGVKEKEKEDRRTKSWIFPPAVTVSLTTLVISFVRIDSATLDDVVMVGVACLISFVLTVIVYHPKVSEACENTTKQLMQIDTPRLLPQLLGALGTPLTETGAGDVISTMVSSVVPSGSILIRVVIYCLGVIIFTMIMGNAFVTFSVITLGIGVPSIIIQGKDPVAIGASDTTYGFCGILLTSMVANFNIVPTAVLEARNKWTVIRAQAPMIFTMTIVHVVLMLLLAFWERKLFVRILMTGFDPFGGEPINPATGSVKLLPATVEGAEIIKLEILIVVHKSLQVIREVIQKHDPDMILSIGQTGGRSDLTMECIGINIGNCHTIDNEDNQPIDEPVFADGDAVYFSNLPIKVMMDEIRRNKIPASISDSAGIFACSHVFYGICYIIKKELAGKESGFVYIPYLSRQVVDKSGQSNITLEVAVKGPTYAISVVIRNEVDVKTAGDTTCQNEAVRLWVPTNGIV